MRRQEIESRAKELLRDHGLLGLAVDPIKLANVLGARVFNAKFGEQDVHGLLARRDGTVTIYVSAEDAPVRKRFTIAHELGHLVLHLGAADGEFVDDTDNFRTLFDPEEAWTPARRQEWEANVFASALLMDEDLVRTKWSEIQDVEGMARWLQVSRQAMEFRLATIGLQT